MRTRRGGIRAHSADPGTVSQLNDSGAVIATADELIVIQRLWLDGPHLSRKSCCLAKVGARGDVLDRFRLHGQSLS